MKIMIRLSSTDHLNYIESEVDLDISSLLNQDDGQPSPEYLNEKGMEEFLSSHCIMEAIITEGEEYNVPDQTINITGLWY